MVGSRNDRKIVKGKKILIIRRVDQEQADRYPGVPRFALANNELGHKSLHVGDLTFLPGSSVPYHFHNEGAEETQIMLSGELECWVDGSRTTVRAGDTVTAPPGILHAFHNRTDTPARMITAFPLTPPETTHVDDPELVDVADHDAIVRAGTRSAPFKVGLDGVERIELSGDFSGAKSTYTYFLEIQPGSAVPVQRHADETALFLVEGTLTGIIGENAVLGQDDAAVVPPGVMYGFANQGSSVARLIVVHPVLNPVVNLG